jgi:transcription elongation GreA/GreB family factor
MVASSTNQRDKKMDKEEIKQTMLSLEADQLTSAQEEYLEYVASARLDRSEPVDIDEQAQAEFAGELSEALDAAVHDHSDKIAKLKSIDFGSKSKVEEGAIVKVAGRLFVIAISTAKFSCHGTEFMGISTRAPIYEKLEGKRAGDKVTFNGKKLPIEDVA